MDLLPEPKKERAYVMSLLGVPVRMAHRLTGTREFRLRSDEDKAVSRYNLKIAIDSYIEFTGNKIDKFTLYDTYEFIDQPKGLKNATAPSIKSENKPNFEARLPEFGAPAFKSRQ